MSLGELGRITAGEKLLLARLRAGETQAQTAERLGLSRKIYGLVEQDRRVLTTVVPAAGSIGSRTIRPHERCLLYRRRAGWTQERVANDLDMSRWWVNQMERGLVSCDRLLWYWEQ